MVPDAPRPPPPAAPPGRPASRPGADHPRPGGRRAVPAAAVGRRGEPPRHRLLRLRAPGAHPADRVGSGLLSVTMPNPPAQISRLLRAAVRRAQHPGFFFVNIGANDGVSNDPVYPFLREYGWRGIAVEPLEPIFAELRQNYRSFPNVILERTAIAPDARPLYYLPASSGYERIWTKQVGTLDREFLLRAIRLMRTYEFEGLVPAGLEESVARVDVPCLTFDALMAKHEVERVDFINFDAEGLDYEIVRTIDLARWQ